MLNLANQQVTSSWFTGILDGEGCFQKTEFGCGVRIFNSDLDIIEACEKFLEENYIVFTRYTMKKYKNRKRMYEILIKYNSNDFLSYPAELYKLIENNLECRRDQYQQILGTSETLRAISVDLDWLIGVWEAEGSWSLIINYKNQSQFEMNIGNTNKKIVDKIILNLKAINCPHYIWHKEATPPRKEAWWIKMGGMKRCEKFLLATEGKWISSRSQKKTDLMLEFIGSRKMMRPNEPRSERQHQIIQTMIDLNR